MSDFLRPSSRVPRPRRRSITVAIGLGVLSMLLLAPLAPPATARGGPVPPAVSAPVTEFVLGPPVHAYRAQYGNTMRGEFVVGPSTTKAIIDVSVPSFGSTVTCGHRDDLGVEAPATEFTAEEWDRGPSLDIARPRRAEGWEGFFCSNSDPVEKWELGWTAVVVAEAPAVLALTDDPIALSSSSDRYTHRHEGTTTVVLGSRIRLVGAPGRWRTADEKPYLWAGLCCWADEGSQALEEARVSRDGAVFGFTMPTELEPFLLVAGDITIDVGTGTGTSPQTYPGYLKWTEFLAVVEVVEPSTTVVRLSTPVTLSFLRTPVRVLVESTGSTPPVGVVTFRVDGRTVGSTLLRRSDGGRARFTLPRLPRGDHTVTATFGGSPAEILPEFVHELGKAPSASASTRLRVLF